MLAQLVVISGPEQGQTFPLSEGQTLAVGRADTTDTRLTDPTVSRTHCQIEAAGGNFRLRDLGSRGGTYVNGQPVSECELAPGDVIRVGSTELRLLPEATEEAPSAQQGRRPRGRAPGVSVLLGLVGKKIAHFEIQQKVATGCSGMVFRAHDVKEGRTVALKVLWPDTAANDEAVRRFVRAMKTMLPIRHPNIVALYGAGKTGPYCWLAMEYVEGESLTQLIQQSGVAGVLDWRQAYRVALHVGRALQEAYAHEILHRNITPANILVRTADQMIKLGDLLLAKALAGSLVRSITQIGQLIGDVYYMSPERTRGEAEMDGRSDLYSLGATVYAVLTGHPPFEGDSLLELVTKLREAEPVRPSTYQPEIPDEFERLVLRMLAKRPEDRHQTPGELLRELDRVGRQCGVTA